MLRNRLNEWMCGCFLGPDEGAGGSGGEGGSEGGKGGEGGAGGSGGGTPKTYDEEHVRKLNSEAAGYRTRANKAERELEEFRKSQLTDAEKKELRLKELESENTTLKGRERSSRIEALAAKAGARDADVVALLVPADAEDLAKAITEIKKARPHLFGSSGSVDGGAGGGGGGSAGTMNDFIRRSAGRG